MRAFAFAVVALTMVGCSGVQASRSDGMRYWCVPANANDRGRQAELPRGTELSVLGTTGDVQVATPAMPKVPAAK